MSNNNHGWTFAISGDVNCFEVECISNSKHAPENDDAAAKIAASIGVPIIPEAELPKNFDRKYFGWIDTPSNRKCIELAAQGKNPSKTVFFDMANAEVEELAHRLHIKW